MGRKAQSKNTYTPIDRRQQQAHQQSKLSHNARMQKMLTKRAALEDQRNKSIELSKQSINDANSLIKNYQDSQPNINESRKASVNLLQIISNNSSPFLTMRHGNKSIKSDLGKLEQQQNILNGAYLHVMLNIKSEYDNVHFVLKALLSLWSSANSATNSQLYSLVSDALIGKDNEIDGELKVKYLRAFQKHLTLEKTAQVFDKRGLNVAEIKELLEEQIESVLPKEELVL